MAAASTPDPRNYGIDAASIVIPGEDPAAFEALTRDYFNDLRPEGPLQRFLVETMILAEWNKRRFARIEARLMRSALAGSDYETVMEDRTLQRLHRRLQSFDRTYFQALKELRRAQRVERTPEESCRRPEPAAIPVEVPPGAPKSQITHRIQSIGFVPSNCRVPENGGLGEPDLNHDRQREATLLLK